MKMINSLMIGIATAFASVTWTWSAALSIVAFNDHAAQAAIAQSLDDIKSDLKDIKDNLNDPPKIKATMASTTASVYSATSTALR